MAVVNKLKNSSWLVTWEIHADMKKNTEIGLKGQQKERIIGTIRGFKSRHKILKYGQRFHKKV